MKVNLPTSNEVFNVEAPPMPTRTPTATNTPNTAKYETLPQV